MADPYTIILGNNEISNCDAALIIEGDAGRPAGRTYTNGASAWPTICSWDPSRVLRRGTPAA